MVYSLFLIFVGAAIFATIALVARQSLIIGYIVLGIVLGPWGLAWVTDTKLIEDISTIGIIFLLFLLGLNLSPRKLLELLKQTTIVTILTSAEYAKCHYRWCVMYVFKHHYRLEAIAHNGFAS